MSSADPYGRTDQLDESLLEVLAARLEARAEHPYFDRMLTEYLDAMDIDQAKAVLDMGSGTGVASRAVARRPSFTGSVIGIDLSPYLTAVATRLAAEEAVAGVEFRVGDSASVDLASEEFDAVIAHTPPKPRR